MRVHHAKMHHQSLVNPDMRSLQCQRQLRTHLHAVDGMPICTHCQTRFSTWTAFKKHILNSCQALKRAPEPSADLLVAHTKPLSERQEVQDMMREKGWLSIVEQYRAELRHHCVVCHQWVSQTRCALKTHVRMAHPAVWAHRDDCLAMCSREPLGRASKFKPCVACGALPAHTKHAAQCTVLFQAALLTKLIPRPAQDEPDPSTGVSVSLRHDHALLGPRPPGLHRYFRAEGRRARHKWAKPESKGGKGRGQQGRPQGQRRDRGSQNWGPDAASSRGVTQVLQTVQRILTRHEDVIVQVRADSSFVLFLEKGSHSLLNPLLQVSQRWKSLKESKPEELNMALRQTLLQALLQELLSRHNKFVASEAAIADARKAGLVAAAGNSWAYLDWDHRASQQIPSPTKAPMSFEQAHATMQKILSYIPKSI